MIDEYEIYQHPNKQLDMSRVLLSLASGEISGPFSETQVIDSTHPLHFVGIDRLEQIRLVRKASDASGGPRTIASIKSSFRLKLPNQNQ